MSLLFAFGSGSRSLQPNTLQVPNVQATNILISNIATTSVQLNFTPGNGQNRMVVMKANTAVDDVLVVNNFSYTASSAFGSGQNLGSGNYVVFNDSGTAVTVTGLTQGTSYHIKVYEFNGSGVNTMYNKSFAAGNPNSFTTAVTQAFTHYVTKTGSNSNSGTSLGQAWLTMEHARANVANGNSLFVGNGIYTINEYMAWPACSITGESEDGVIFRIHSSKYVALQDNPFTTQSSGLCLFNCRTTGARLNVPFTFQNFTIDGSKPTGSHSATTLCMGGAITVVNRNSFTLNNVTLKDIGHWGCWLWNSDNSRITSCSSYNAGRGRVASGNQPWSYGMGHYPFYRTNNFRFDNNYVNDDWGSQPMGSRGGNWTTAAYNGGTLNICDGIDIHDNYMTLDSVGPWVSPNGAFSQAISMEFIRVYAPNTRIYNNDIDANISLSLFSFDDGTVTPEVHTAKGVVQYDIHDNRINCKRRSSTTGQFGIEMIGHDVKVYNNYITANNYCLVCFQAHPTHGLRFENVDVYNNVFDGMRGNAAFTGFFWHAQGVKNLRIWNNTAYCDTTSTSNAVLAFLLLASPGSEVYPNAGVSENISIRNNIVVRPNTNVATVYSVYKAATHAVINLTCTNNNFWGCNVTNPPNSASIGIFNNNLNVNPLIVGSGSSPEPFYTLQSGSPMIDAGINVGLPFVGSNPDIGKYEFGVVTTRNIVSLESVPIVTVNQGTILTAIPLGIVQCTLDDDSIVNLNLEYVSGSYDGNTPDAYSLTCKPTLIVGITNTSNLTVVKTVIVRSIISLIVDDFERSSLGDDYTEVDPENSLLLTMDNNQALAMSAFQDSFDGFVYRNDFSQEEEVKLTIIVNFGVLDITSFGNGVGLQNLYGSLSISETEPNYGVVARVNTISGHEDFGKILIFSGDGTVAANYIERNKSSAAINLIVDRLYNLIIERAISGSDAIYNAYLEDTITGQQITAQWTDVGDLLGTKYSETYPAFFAFGGYPKIHNFTVDEINVSAPAYNSRLQAKIDRANSLGIALPSILMLEKESNLYDALDAISGYWASKIAVYVKHTDNSAKDFADLNSVNPATFQTTWSGGPPFANLSGYVANGSTHNGTTGFDPLTNGGSVWTTNEACFEIYIANNPTGTNDVVAIGAQDASAANGIYFNPKTASGFVNCRINSATVWGYTDESGNSNAFWKVLRTGGTNRKIFKNGSNVLNSSTVHTLGLTNDDIAVNALNNNGNVQQRSTYIVGFLSLGAPNEGDEAAVAAAWANYIS